MSRQRDAVMFLAVCITEGKVTLEQAVDMFRTMDAMASDMGNAETNVKRVYKQLVKLEKALGL